MIIWSCPVCGDNGYIREYEDTPWDRSRHAGGEILTGDFMAALGDHDAEQAAIPKFTPKATKMWENLHPDYKLMVLNNVYCVHCSKTGSMQLLQARVERNDLILQGACLKCGEPVTRVVESG